MKWPRPPLLIAAALLGCTAATHTAPARWTGDFEARDGLWQLRGGSRLDDSAAHGGRRALHVVGHGQGGTAILDDSLRGQRVTLEGWIRVGALRHGFVELWLRADGPEGTLARTGRRLTGRDGWARAEMSIDVPTETDMLVIGGRIDGDGEAWFDDLALHAGPAPPISLVEVQGSIVPGPGAVVALIPEGLDRARAIVHADAAGTFRAWVPRGRYAVTATCPGRVAAFRAPSSIDEPVRLILGHIAHDTIALRGVIEPVVAHARVAATRDSADDGDVFYTATAQDGTFAMALPAGNYTIDLDADGFDAAPVVSNGTAPVTLRAMKL